MSPAVAAQYVEVGIPAIAVDIPHPGATFFGANNHQAGSVVASRVTGVLTGVLEVLPELEGRCPVTHLDGDGQFKLALERVRHHLRGSKAKHVLVGCVNDASALAAVRAFQEAGRADRCAVVGQNAEPDARSELRQPTSPLVASVGYFPERYGDALIRLALDILSGKAVPPAV